MGRKSGILRTTGRPQIESNRQAQFNIRLSMFRITSNNWDATLPYSTIYWKSYSRALKEVLIAAEYHIMTFPCKSLNIETLEGIYFLIIDTVVNDKLSSTFLSSWAISLECRFYKLKCWPLWKCCTHFVWNFQSID